jgi:hypothetical protein
MEFLSTAGLFRAEADFGGEVVCWAGAIGVNRIIAGINAILEFLVMVHHALDALK